MFYIKISNLAKTTKNHMKIIENQFRKKMKKYT